MQKILLKENGIIIQKDDKVRMQDFFCIGEAYIISPSKPKIFAV